MVTTEELFQAGRLDDAISAQTAEVKANPSDAERRYLLFALLCFQGNLERADRQLDALGMQDPKLEMATSIYRNLLASELDRTRVFGQDARPVLPPDAPDSIEPRLEALRNQRAGMEFASLLEKAREAESAVSGRLSDAPFGGIEDLDEFLGPVLEVYAGGRYLWMPFSCLRRLQLTPPVHLLDLLWIRAEITDSQGNDAHVHLPALYAGSANSGHESIQLGRVTEWEDLDGTYRGRGQKLFQLASADSGDPVDLPILEMRELQLDAPAGS